MSELFKDEAAKDRMLRWHERFRQQLRMGTEVVEVETSFGDTRVLIGGPHGGLRVVLLHDAFESSAQALLKIEPLMKRFRVHAVDMLGQSPRSADRRLPVEGEEHGLWLGEVLNELGLTQTHLIGVGWGGYVALRFAALHPERIERLALLVPSGIVEGEPWPNLPEGFFSSLVSRLFSPTKEVHRAILEYMSAPDPEWAAYLEEALMSYRPDPRRPPPAKEGELDGLTAPTLVIAAEADRSAPGAALLARAARIIPSLTDTYLIPNCQHLPPTDKRTRQKLSRRIGHFMLVPEPRWSQPFLDKKGEG